VLTNSSSISWEQSGFFENCSILDNVMVASNFLHYMECKTTGRIGEMTLKININKAYDKVMTWGM
jgi:hypothetical protein